MMDVCRRPRGCSPDTCLVLGESEEGGVGGVKAPAGDPLTLSGPHTVLYTAARSGEVAYFVGFLLRAELSRLADPSGHR